MRLVSVAGLLLTAITLGCTRGVDPCPEGASLHGDQCAREEMRKRLDASRIAHPTTPEDELEDAGHDSEVSDPDADDYERDGDQDDASELQDATRDADLDAADPIDATDASMPDEIIDARPAPLGDAAPDSGLDASPDAGDAGSSLCAPEDVARWQDFHLSSLLTVHLASCAVATVDCSLASCPALQCLLPQLDMLGCDTCATDEAACIATACAASCGTFSEPEACRACACRNGCSTAFEACSRSTIDVCADCNGTTCTRPLDLPPEMIIPVVQHLLP